jgi:hypothetical protein
LRRRDIRKAKALKYLAVARRASALALGTAAVAGEPKLHAKARAGIGLGLGLYFVERGFARPTRFNQFAWMPPTK